MHPDDRRDALIAVFIDLAHREGRKPTTSEIAHEAGVAEGTIFRVFPTKEALETEAVQSAFCPAPVRAAITAIDQSQSMRDRLVAFTTIMQRRFRDVFGLMAALGLSQPPSRGPHLACFDAGRHLRDATDEGHEHEAAHQPLLDAINAALVDDSIDLVVPARDVIHRIRLLTFSGSHPGIADGMVLTPEEIVDTVLYGLVVRPSPTGSGLMIAELCEALGGDAETLRRVSRLDGSHERLSPAELEEIRASAQAGARPAPADQTQRQSS